MTTRVSVDIASEPEGMVRGHAACEDYDPELWFSPLRSETLTAIEICQTQCRVAERCKAWAHDNHVPYGVWGGETQEERVLALTGQILDGTRTRTIATCEQCGCVFRRGRKRQRFCSHDCHNRSLRAQGRTGCGSPHGARRHRHHGEPVDKACQMAESLYYAQRRAAKKAEKAREATP